MPAPRSQNEPQRIAKLLARAGVASRREIERMIAERRIAIDGVPVETPATLLNSLSGVTVDGTPVREPAPARLFLYHKHAGVLTAERDPQGRPTIYDRMPKDLPRLMPVGRLDLNTEGLLLLTSDGGLKRQLELPSSGVERVYRARTFGEISQEQLETLIEGIEIEGIRYGPIDANLERRTGRNQWIEVKITEGKNREVRRVLEHLGLQVSRLIRVAYGPFVLGDLPAGQVEEIRQHELVLFRKDLTGAQPAALRAVPDRATRPRAPARPPRPPASGATSRGNETARPGPTAHWAARQTDESGQRDEQAPRRTAQTRRPGRTGSERAEAPLRPRDERAARWSAAARARPLASGGRRRRS